MHSQISFSEHAHIPYGCSTKTSMNFDSKLGCFVYRIKLYCEYLTAMFFCFFHYLCIHFPFFRETESRQIYFSENRKKSNSYLRNIKQDEK